MRLILLLPVLLSACVLHARAPLLGEAAAVPLLGTAPLRFEVATSEAGAWVLANPSTIEVVPQGKHYLIPLDGTSETYAFVPLDATHYVVEVVAGGEADYGIATWDGTTLLASALQCDQLKTSLATNADVEFVSDGCGIRDTGAPVLEVFARLAERAGPPTLRLVRQ